jgi:hypothetical protein
MEITPYFALIYEGLTALRPAPAIARASGPVFAPENAARETRFSMRQDRSLRL